LGYSVERILALSYFRIGFLKRFIPTSILVLFDALLQWTGSFIQITPSVFVKAVGGNRTAKPLKKNPSVLEFFKCPDCEHSPLTDHSDYLECSNCKKRWEFKDGIYDFREPVSKN